jgi:hypothetical protein
VGPSHKLESRFKGEPEGDEEQSFSLALSMAKDTLVNPTVNTNTTVAIVTCIFFILVSMFVILKHGENFF